MDMYEKFLTLAQTMGIEQSNIATWVGERVNEEIERQRQERDREERSKEREMRKMLAEEETKKALVIAEEETRKAQIILETEKLKQTNPQIFHDTKHDDFAIKMSKIPVFNEKQMIWKAFCIALRFRQQVTIGLKVNGR